MDSEWKTHPSETLRLSSFNGKCGLLMFDWDKVVLCQSWCWYEVEWAERNDCRPADTNLLDVTETLHQFPL